MVPARIWLGHWPLPTRAPSESAPSIHSQAWGVCPSRDFHCLLIHEAYGSCFQLGRGSEHCGAHKGSSGMGKAFSHINHLTPHPPSFPKSQVVGQRYWEAEGEHRAENLSFLLSLSFPYPCPSPSLCLHPLSNLFDKYIWRPHQRGADPEPPAVAKRDMVLDISVPSFSLGKQTWNPVLSYSIIQSQLCWGPAKLGFHLGGGGMRLSSWFRSKGVWCSLQITLAALPRVLLCVKPCARHLACAVLILPPTHSDTF